MLFPHDFASHVGVRQACLAVLLTNAGAVVGPTLDCETARSGLMCISCSILNAGDSVTTILVRHSADGVVWATLATGVNITDGSAFDGALQVIELPYMFRYVRLNYTDAAAVGITSTFAAVLSIVDPYHAPLTTVVA